MGEKIQLLDHGYLKFVEGWGSDQSIVEAARMSTGKGFLGWGGGWKCSNSECDWVDRSSHTERDDGDPCPHCSTGKIVTFLGDEKLLRYLYENKHATPFEMGGLIIEVQAPIFVFREWHRHRTQSYNEASARYEPLPDLNYIPTVERLMMGSGHLTKQAGTIKGADALTSEAAEFYRAKLKRMYEEDQVFYDEAMKMGVPKELARVHLPVGRYSKMRASANLRNWLAFLTLRSDKKAQYEIRVYAEAIATLLQGRFSRTMALFNESR